MNDDFIVPVYVVLDETMRALAHRSHPLAQISDAEVLTVAVVAAKYCHNHHERALHVLQLGHYLSGRLSTSRLNRRLHALAAWFRLLLETPGELFAHGATFLLDSMPVPVCRRARAGRCRTLRGRACCGYCAAKREHFFGWRLHLICTTSGVPVAFDLLPGGLHALTPVHELTYGVPAGATVYADTAYNAATDEASLLAETGVRLVPLRRTTMAPNRWADKLALRAYRKRIEALYSQLEALGTQRLHARTNPGLGTQAPRLAVGRRRDQRELAIRVESVKITENGSNLTPCTIPALIQRTAIGQSRSWRVASSRRIVYSCSNSR